MIARGIMLGPDQPVILHMLDIPPAAESLNGVKMELVDAAFPLLKGTYRFVCSLCDLSIKCWHLFLFYQIYHSSWNWWPNISYIWTGFSGVVATIDVVEACTGVNIAIMVGGFPRKEGMERKDVMSKNVSIYKSQASALENHAAANCKVWNIIDASTSYMFFPSLLPE